MTTEARIALINCTRCGKLAHGPEDMHTCLVCIERIREQIRCPDCDSTVTVALTEGVICADLRHDPTCQRWLKVSGGDPDHPDILWGPR